MSYSEKPPGLIEQEDPAKAEAHAAALVRLKEAEARLSARLREDEGEVIRNLRAQLAERTIALEEATSRLVNERLDLVKAKTELAERTRERDNWEAATAAWQSTAELMIAQRDTAQEHARDLQATLDMAVQERELFREERDEARAAFDTTFQKLTDKELELTRALLDLSQLRADLDEQARVADRATAALGTAQNQTKRAEWERDVATVERDTAKGRAAELSLQLQAERLESERHARSSEYWNRRAEEEHAKGAERLMQAQDATRGAERLREALRFYADTANWAHQAHSLQIYSNVSLDLGKRARAALEPSEPLANLAVVDGEDPQWCEYCFKRLALNADSEGRRSPCFCRQEKGKGAEHG